MAKKKVLSLARKKLPQTDSWKMGLSGGKWALQWLDSFAEPEQKITWRRRWAVWGSVCHFKMQAAVLAHKHLVPPQRSGLSEIQAWIWQIGHSAGWGSAPFQNDNWWSYMSLCLGQLRCRYVPVFEHLDCTTWVQIDGGVIRLQPWV